MPLIPRIKGRHGEVTVAGLGAVVGRFDGQDGWWELIRREDGQQQGKPVVYRLRAVLSYSNPGLWERFENKIRLTIRVGEVMFRVEVAEDQRMELKGRTLQSEGVTLCQIESP